eukprot:gene24189-29258_t
MLASANDRLEEVKELCKSSEDVSALVNNRGGWNKCTALLLAAQAGHASIVSYLIEEGRADVGACNDVGSTALHLAASKGHLNVVQILISHGAKQSIVNNDSQTAMLLAVKEGHVNVVKYLDQIREKSKDDSDPLLARNAADKTALLLACELGHKEVFDYILNSRGAEFLNQQTGRGITCLMLACSMNTPAHVSIVRSILKHTDVVDVNYASVWRWTALLWACYGGSSETVQMLLSLGAEICVESVQQDTPFLKAIEQNHRRIVHILIAHGALQLNKKKDMLLKGLKLAISMAHIDIARDLHALLYAEQPTESTLVCLLSTDEVYHAVLKLTLPAKLKELERLVTYAGSVDFFFELYLACLIHFRSPKLLLSNLLRRLCFRLISNSKRQTDVDLVHKIIQLGAVLLETSRLHPIERKSIHDVYIKLTTTLDYLLAHEVFHDEPVLYLVLNYPSLIAAEPKHYDSYEVQRSQAFLTGPLQVAVSGGIKDLFAHSHVSAYVQRLFYSGLRDCPDSEKSGTNYLRSAMIKLSGYLHARFRPAVMFFFEGLSKVLMLALVFSISNSYYTSWQKSGDGNYPNRVPTESFLLILTLSTVLYEYGSLVQNNVFYPASVASVVGYLEDIWNLLDLSSLCFIITWAGMSYLGSTSEHYMQAHAALACSCIPLAMSLLQYAGLVEKVGKLTIMIMAMVENLGPLSVVFIVVLAGYVLTMSALFSSSNKGEAFSSPVQAALTLFSTSLNNYENTFTETFSVYGSLETWGICIQLTFIIGFSIVLLSLVIAQMSATHQRVDEKAYEEWQFGFAKTTQQFLLLHERHPFSMLPPPLNLIPICLSPVHYFVLWFYDSHTLRNKVLSVSGTASDMLMGTIMSFVAPWIEYVLYVIECCKINADMGMMEMLLVVVLFPVFWYPAFVVSLLARMTSIRTYIQLTARPSRASSLVASEKKSTSLQKVAPQGLMRGQSKMSGNKDSKSSNVTFLSKVVGQMTPGALLLDYPTSSHFTPYINSTLSLENMNILTVKLIRCHKLRFANTFSDPIVYFRLGDMKLHSSPSLYGGKDPLWLNEVLTFPLHGSSVPLQELTLSMVVVDRDAVHGHEVFLGERGTTSLSKLPALKITPWIANAEYSGKIALEEAAGEVEVAIKVHFPDFLTTFKAGAVTGSNSTGISSQDHEQQAKQKSAKSVLETKEDIAQHNTLHFIASIKQKMHDKRSKLKPQPHFPIQRAKTKFSVDTDEADDDAADREDDDEYDENNQQKRQVEDVLKSELAGHAVHFQGLFLLSEQEKRDIFSPLLRKHVGSTGLDMFHGGRDSFLRSSLS